MHLSAVVIRTRPCDALLTQTYTVRRYQVTVQGDFACNNSVLIGERYRCGSSETSK